MNAGPSVDFGIALLIGAIAVWFHAWNQFNRPLYGQSPEFARLLTKLQPSDLRNGGAFLQSFLIYVSILTIIYLALCVFLTVPSLHDLVVQIPGIDLLDGKAGAVKLPEQTPGLVAGVAFDDMGGFAALGPVDQATGPSTSIPLAVSLAVVGLAPNIPWLGRFEMMVRGTAHRLSGIPTQLVSSTLSLRSDPLIPDDTESGILLSANDWKRIADYEAAATKAGVAFRDEFVRDIRNIIALRLWVLEGAVGLRDNSVRYTYIAIEEEVQTRITSLIEDIDAVVFPAGSAQRGSAGPGGKPRRDWPALVREAEETLEDICLLVLLYSEHRAMSANADASNGISADPERKKATGYLFEALQRAVGQSDAENAESMLFFRLTGAILIVSIVLGAVLYRPAEGGAFTVNDLLVQVLIFASSSAATYIVPLFFALSYHQTASHHAKRGRGWENSFATGSKPSRVVPQLLILFLISVCVALVVRVAFHLFYLAASVGTEAIRARLSVVLDYAIKIEIVYALLGGVLAMSIVLIVDACRAGRLPMVKWALILLPPVILGFIQISAGLILNLVGGKRDFRDYVPLAINAAPPVVIGLVVAIYTVRSLRDEFPQIYAKGLHHV